MADDNVINYADRIPNNVDLASDRTLQRALERWQPAFLNWWQEAGPSNSSSLQVYLRTAVSVDRDGWANFDYVRMPDYRWGIFLVPRDEDRRIHFGAHKGEPVWQEVPGEYRSQLQRLIVTQGDTEPASVEQQRLLGATCPSLYDLRNLFQVNVEEGRHLWAMVYLLHRFFGREGREEGEALLQRRSGDVNNPRILTAFNEQTSHWLAFFMFAFFTDRDGKFQLSALAESAFDPLARTTRFMLTEEAHHMFVGESGIARVIQRTCEAMRDEPADGCRPGRGAPARRHRFRHPAAIRQLPLQRHARSVRRGDLVERRQLLYRRAQGPLRGSEGRRRSRVVADGVRGAADRRRSDRDPACACPDRPQCPAARRLHGAKSRPPWPGGTAFQRSLASTAGWSCRTSASIARSAPSRVVT